MGRPSRAGRVGLPPPHPGRHHPARAVRSGPALAVLPAVGGGSPKNFLLQTEPQIQEVLGLADAGHDYFLQITDARPDTGGLSGATPGEAVSWGKVDPERLPDAVVVYCDSTIALPILTQYVLEKGIRREPRRLFERHDELLARLRETFAGMKEERRREGTIEAPA